MTNEQLAVNKELISQASQLMDLFLKAYALPGTAEYHVSGFRDAALKLVKAMTIDPVE